MKYMQNLPSGGYLGKLANNSANGKRPFFIFWGCNMVPVPKERKKCKQTTDYDTKKNTREKFRENKIYHVQLWDLHVFVAKSLHYKNCLFVLYFVFSCLEKKENVK